VQGFERFKAAAEHRAASVTEARKDAYRDVFSLRPFIRTKPACQKKRHAPDGRSFGVIAPAWGFEPFKPLFFAHPVPGWRGENPRCLARAGRLASREKLDARGRRGQQPAVAHRD